MDGAVLPILQPDIEHQVGSHVVSHFGELMNADIVTCLLHLAGPLMYKHQALPGSFV